MDLNKKGALQREHLRFSTIWEQLGALYINMPRENRKEYLCFMRKEAYNAATVGIHPPKKAIKLVPRGSRLLLTILTDANTSESFAGRYEYLGSFNYLFTFDPDWDYFTVRRWLVYKNNLAKKRLLLNVNRKKKICKSTKGYCCKLAWQGDLPCKCELR